LPPNTSSTISRMSNRCLGANRSMKRSDPSVQAIIGHLALHN
jgi:hypothetical protein